jgi:hypothetical protein
MTVTTQQLTFLHFGMCVFVKVGPRLVDQLGDTYKLLGWFQMIEIEPAVGTGGDFPETVKAFPALIFLGIDNSSLFEYTLLRLGILLLLGLDGMTETTQRLTLFKFEC